jgi:hypothetical protein
MWEYVEPDWDDPSSLRLAAARLRARAEMRDVELSKFRHFAPEPEPDPLPAGVSRLMRDHTYDEEAEEKFRTAKARAEIERALLAEQAETQQKLDQKRAAMRRTVLGGLLR